ncbi:glycosyltransferase family 2 protein [Lentzea sp. NEAU-D7]|uniref:glycosyltransferase family 2 protein n=1 Tax=Lentzea sp. NEAU-D7 TaxID=2994667 RepID=UPI00224A57A4|nr:glycosyltransferase [Lentzea sp. NEAU-D7]MCX2954588.1 glycosyltransferase [Lentzea sp. NEAU-D7]
MSLERARTVVVGIPARNEERTIATVLSNADIGLQGFCDLRTACIVLADNGSTDSTIAQFAQVATNSPKKTILSPAEGTGKGTNVFAIFREAERMDADTVVLLDADVRSARPEWVKLLADAVDCDEPSLAVPVYTRNRYEANTTNHLVGPLLAGVFGVRVQQPIGGEFAVNRAFLQRLSSWRRPASAQLYGIDVWMTANALRDGLRLVEVPLGRKLHNSPFPKILSLPQQVLDSLFNVLTGMGSPGNLEVTLASSLAAVAISSRMQDETVVRAVIATTASYVESHWSDMVALLPSAAHARPFAEGLHVPAELWPCVLADALSAVAAGEVRRARDHLIALYVNRVFTFWREIAGLGAAAVDELLEVQADRMVAEVRARELRFQDAFDGGEFTKGLWEPFATAEPVLSNGFGASEVLSLVPDDADVTSRR